MRITIDGKAYRPSLPIGVTYTHEGGLDQACLKLRHTDRQEALSPFTHVKLLDRWWVIARDDVVRERYTDKATHNLMLLEATKELERVPCGAKTFTKPLRLEYTSVPAEQTVTMFQYANNSWTGPIETDAYVVCDLKTGIAEGTPLTIPAIVEWAHLSDLIKPSERTYYSVDGGPLIEVFLTDAVVDTSRVSTVQVVFERSYSIDEEEGEKSTLHRSVFDIKITRVENENKKTPLTVFEAVERLLITADPVRSEGERAYFHDVGTEGAIDTRQFECPELSFANEATLKENLDAFAKYLHAKTKLRFDEEGKGHVYFIPLTSARRTRIKGCLIGDQSTFECTKYGGRVETNAANLVIGDSSEAVVSDPSGPFRSMTSIEHVGMRTLRASDMEARISDTTGEIETTLPIRRITRLLMKCKGDNRVLDLTKWVNEESRYRGLSNYMGDYSKSYSLYYTQGSRGIKGLFFKDENAKPSALTRYSITNIYNEATGESVDSLSNYCDLLFSVEYEPYLNVRLVNSRTDKRGKGIGTIVNQSANELDKEALGAFLHGTAEQMTSDAPKLTYLLRDVSDLPDIGTMPDEKNYITAISFEIYASFVKAMLSVSEHYNRLGEHVSVPNAVRQYEIDTKNVTDRSVLYTDVCTISLHAPTAEDDSLLTPWAKRLLCQWLCNHNEVSGDHRMSLMRVKTYAAEHGRNLLPREADARRITEALLPVASFGFGNSVAFVASMADNFSVGKQARQCSGKQYHLQSYMEYGDCYGDAEFLSFELLNGMGAFKEGDAGVELGRSLPAPLYTSRITYGEVGISTVQGEHPLLYLFKDSRERIMLTYQLLFESDSGLIIGNDLSSLCPFVRTIGVDEDGHVEHPQIYLYGNGTDGPYLDPIGGTTKRTDNPLSVQFLEHEGYCLRVPPFNERPHSAWAMIYRGKFLLGANKRLEPDCRIYFNFSHK